MMAATEMQLKEIRARVQLERAERKILNIGEHIDPSIESFSTIGLALSEIRQQELWKSAGFTSWSEYCISRFNYTERRADELIESVIARKNLEKEREKERELGKD